MKSLKGNLLIASPGLLDPNFRRGVVLLAEHNEDGAFGLILNRPAKTRVAELWGAISSEDVACEDLAFVGGPVQQNAVLLLHGYPELAADEAPVVPGVYVGSEVELLEKLLHRGAGPEVLEEADRPRFRVFCGYSGWGEGQLDREVRAGGWLQCPATAKLVFETPPEQLWGVLLESLGGVYKFFARMPNEPELN